MGMYDKSEDEDELLDSRYAAAHSKTVVSNPFFQSDDSDSETDDDGIIVLPKREKTPPEIICLDSNSCSPVPNLSSTIIISDNSGDEVHDGINSRKKRNQDNSVLEVTKENHKKKNKNSKLNIGKMLKKSKG